MNIHGKKGFWKDGWGSFIIAIGIALFIRWGIMEAYVIPSGSMLPSLLVHDHIFVNKFVYGLRVPFSENWLVKFQEPERGEVIVFKFPRNPSQFYIKRIVGLPGDEVQYIKGKLYVNGERVQSLPAESKEEKPAEPKEEKTEAFSEGKSGTTQFRPRPKYIPCRTISSASRSFSSSPR